MVPRMTKATAGLTVSLGPLAGCTDDRELDRETVLPGEATT